VSGTTEFTLDRSTDEGLIAWPKTFGCTSSHRVDDRATRTVKSSAMSWEPASLLEALDESVCVCTRDGTIVYVNPAGARTAGCSRDAILGKRIWELFPDSIVNGFQRAFESVSASGGPLEIDSHYAPWDRWFRTQLYRIDDHVHVVAREITQQRVAEARLRVLAHASEAFACCRDLDRVFGTIARSLAELVGDGCVVRVLDGAHLRAVAVHHTDPATLALYREALAKPIPADEGYGGRVVATGEPLFLPRVDTAEHRNMFHSPEVRAHVDRLGVHSTILVALVDGDERIGVVTLMRDVTPRPYTPDDLSLLQDLTERASMAVENARALAAERDAREAAERAARQTRKLQAIGSRLSHRRTPREVAQTILDESIAVLGDATGAIWLVDESGARLEMLAQVGYPDPSRFSAFPLAADIPLATAARTAMPVYLSSVAEYAQHFAASARRLGDAAPAEFATACLPLISEGRAVGGLAFSYAHAHRWRPDECAFLEVLASQCAQAIDRARLLEQERVASAALAESNRTLNTVVHASPAAIIICELDGIVRLWNPAATRIFGWSAGEVLGQRFPAVDASQQGAMRANLERVGRGKELAGIETRLLRRDDSHVDVAMWAAPVVRPGGEVQALAVFVDITDRKQAEALARAADRRKDEFLAMLGHELRNPLAPIMTALDLMKLRGETAAERERQMIERQTRHLVRLVDDLLDISRITRGKIELRKARTDIAAIIASAVEMASPLLEQRSHHVSVAAPRGLVFVDADEFRLAQVFQNLLTNAAKYTPSGGSITVRLTVGGGHAVVEIEDDGEGIAADILPAIFEPFVQGARKIERSTGGLGIGLTLVRSLVALHSGKVEAYSAGPGQGSRFVVRIPTSDGLGREPHGTPSDVRPLHGSARRVLLVDDNQDAAEMLASLLRAVGHEVVVAFDGPSALGRLGTFTPDVALLDIGLPVMDGYDLARRLQELPATPRLIAITGYGQEHDRARTKEAGFAAHLIKPVQAAQVLAAVDESGDQLTIPNTADTAT
jgi:PAS domain S-box-containing protein